MGKFVLKLCRGRLISLVSRARSNYAASRRLIFRDKGKREHRRTSLKTCYCSIYQVWWNCTLIHNQSLCSSISWKWLLYNQLNLTRNSRYTAVSFMNAISIRFLEDTVMLINWVISQCTGITIFILRYFVHLFIQEYGGNKQGKNYYTNIPLVRNDILKPWYKDNFVVDVQLVIF